MVNLKKRRKDIRLKLRFKGLNCKARIPIPTDDLISKNRLFMFHGIST